MKAVQEMDKIRAIDNPCMVSYNKRIRFKEEGKNVQFGVLTARV